MNDFTVGKYVFTGNIANICIRVVNSNGKELARTPEFEYKPNEDGNYESISFEIMTNNDD